MSFPLAILAALSAAPLGSGSATPIPQAWEPSAHHDLASTPTGSEGGNAFGRALGWGLAGSLGGGLAGYWSLRATHASADPAVGGLVGTASGMALGSALGAWSARGAGSRYTNPLPPVLGATLGEALGVGVWGLALAASGNGSSSMSWESTILLLGAPWIGSALGAVVEQDMVKRTASVTPWFPTTGGTGLQVSLRY